MLSELRMEMATWQLIHVLCSDRLTEGMGEEMVTELLVQDRASDRAIVDEYFTRDSSTRQAQARLLVSALLKCPISSSPSVGCGLAGAVC